MHNRKTKEIGNRKFRPPSGKVKNCLFMNQASINSDKGKASCHDKGHSPAAERDWKWLEKAPVIKIPAVETSESDGWKRRKQNALLRSARTTEICRQVCAGNWSEKVEIINLEWQQIDMQRRVAWVNPKRANQTAPLVWR